MNNMTMSLLYLSRKSNIYSLCKTSNIISHFSSNKGYYYNKSATQNEHISKDSSSEPKFEEPVPDQTDTEKELLTKVDVLSKEVEVLKDKYQRTLADRENVRQRLENQIQESKLFGIQNFCKDLLEVSDVFRKAIESVPEEQVKSSDVHFRNLYDGVVMTENQLLAVFRRHGLEKIVPKEGEKFDPSFQEAMFEVPTDDKVPGTIAHIVRTGWKLHHRCVRSAQVGVVKE